MIGSVLHRRGSWPSPLTGRAGRVRHSVVATAVIVWAGVAGLVSVDHGTIAIAIALFPVIAYVFMSWPIIGVMLVIATIPIENMFIVGGFGGTTLTRLLGVGVTGAWLLGKLRRGESFRDLSASVYSWITVIFIAWVLLSSFWADSPVRAKYGAYQLVQLFVLSLVVVDVASSAQKVQWIFRALVIATIFAAAFTVLEFQQAGGVGRAGLRVGGVNGTAQMLVVLTPLAFYMLQHEREWKWRILGALYVVLAVLAIPMTNSRMSLMFFVALMVLMVWETLRAKRGRGIVLAMVGAGLLVAPFYVPLERLETRAKTIVPYLQNTLPSASEGTSIMSGRGYHLLVGWRMFRDHPVKGVGYGNFGGDFLYRYQYEVPGAGGNLWGSWRSPHSSHIGILADLGAVGFGLWAALLVTIIVFLWRSERWARMRGLPARAGMTRMIAYSFLLLAGPYGFYSPTQRDKLFWVLMGIAVAIYLSTRVHTVERLTFQDETG